MARDVGLLSESQCTARNARRQETHKLKRQQQRQDDTVTTAASSCSWSLPAAAAAAASGSESLCHSPLQLLSDDHRDLIALIVAYQDKYDLPTDEDVRKVAVGSL